jgi:hypothetical protein
MEGSVFRRHLRLVVAIAAVGVAVLAGGLIWRWATPPALPQGASPETVARTYFGLDAAGRFLAARHLVSQSGRPDVPDGRGYGGCRIIRVGKAFPDSKQGYGSWYDSFVQICVVTIDYHRTRTDEAGNPPGNYSVAVDLGRKTPGGTWRVLYIGDPI